MEKQTFDGFKDLKKETYGFIKDYREYFVRLVLNKHGVKYNDGMSKREIRELFEEKIVGIVKDEDRNYDMVYKEGNLIGYWNRSIEMFFRQGRLMCRIQYRIF